MISFSPIHNSAIKFSGSHGARRVVVSETSNLNTLLTEFEDKLSLSGRPGLPRQKTTDSMLELDEIPMTLEYDKQKDRQIVKYLTPQESLNYKLTVNDDGELCHSNGVPLRPTGDKEIKTYIYVTDKYRNIFAHLANNKDGIGHSSFKGGEEVTGAGRLVMTKKKALLDNSSGHYKPSRQILEQTLNILKRSKVNTQKFYLLSVSV